MLQLILEFAKDLIHGTEQAVIHLIDENREFLIPEALIGYDKSVEGKKKMRQLISTGWILLTSILNSPLLF